MPYKDKIKRLEYAKEYRKNHKKEMKLCQKIWYLKNKENKLKQCKKYRDMHKKEVSLYHKKRYENNKSYFRKKQCKRLRGLGYNKLVTHDWNEPIHWHHMNDTNIIPIPAYLHKLTYTGDRSNHRMLCNKLIDILYPELNITEKST